MPLATPTLVTTAMRVGLTSFFLEAHQGSGAGRCSYTELGARLETELEAELSKGFCRKSFGG